eukprot:TRINITY_DN16406_c0_g1_i2.p1 TRINITY_DN16406_c0_g1~~TRINITY_DN16406_c0_g1_i2.p1  ORF type:complete len:673 (+),score=117.88 TRINITY_DN16406_c0_g1_i2:105-2021(+)
MRGGAPPPRGTCLQPGAAAPRAPCAVSSSPWGRPRRVCCSSPAPAPPRPPRGPPPPPPQRRRRAAQRRGTRPWRTGSRCAAPHSPPAARRPQPRPRRPPPRPGSLPRPQPPPRARSGRHRNPLPPPRARSGRRARGTTRPLTMVAVRRARGTASPPRPPCTPPGSASASTPPARTTCALPSCSWGRACCSGRPRPRRPRRSSRPATSPGRCGSGCWSSATGPTPPSTWAPQRATRIRAELVVLNRDRARLLAEWAAWHLAIGVAHLYVYDDSSRDNSRPALAALEKAGFVTIMDSKKWDWADKRAADPLAHHQFATYLEFVKYRRRAGAEGPAIPEPPASKGTQSVWVGMLDQDEFLLPTQHECVGEVIEPLLHAHSVGALYVPWTRLGHANVTDYALVRNATLFESTAWSVGESEGVGCATRRESIFHGTGSACWGLGKSIAKLSLIEDSARSYMAMDRDRTFPHVVPLRGELKTANELGWTLPTRFEIKRCSPKVRGVGVSRELLRWKLRCEITLGRLRDQLTQWHAWRANPAHFPTVIVHARSTAFTAVVLPTLDRGRQSAKHGLARRRGLAALWRDFIEEDLGRGFVPLPAQAMPLARRRAALVRRLLRMGSLAPPKVLRPERFDGWARRRPPR